MKTEFLKFLLILILFTSSCKDKVSTIKIDSPPISLSNDTEREAVKIEQEVHVTYKKNSFVNKPFKDNISCTNMIAHLDKNEEYILTKREENNQFDDTKKDTILRYSGNGNSFEILKNETNCFLTQANISNNDLELKNEIEIGMIKNDFLKFFGIQDKNNIINFTDDEEFSNIAFHFIDNELTKIIINNNFN